MGSGAVLVRAATNGSGVLVAGRNGGLVGVGRIVPVGVGKTGWKGVGVGPWAGWKGVAVGLALGLAVTMAKACAAGADPQDALKSVSASSEIRKFARRQKGFI